MEIKSAKVLLEKYRDNVCIKKERALVDAWYASWMKVRKVYLMNGWMLQQKEFIINFNLFKITAHSGENAIRLFRINY